MKGINDLEKDILQTILGNELLLNTVKKVFYERIELEKPEVREGQDNALLGEKYRAYEQGKQMIEKGFIDLLGYRVVKNPIKGFNKAR